MRSKIIQLKSVLNFNFTCIKTIKNAPKYEKCLTSGILTLNSRSFCAKPDAIDEKWIIASKFSDVEIPKVSYTEYINEYQDLYADKIALVDADSGKELTFGECKDLGQRLGSALSRLGVSKGDVVSIISPNCIEYPIAFSGITQIGAIATTVNPAFTLDELVNQLKNSDASCIICHQDELKKVTEARQLIKEIRHIIVIGGKNEGGHLQFENLLKDDGRGIPSDLKIYPEDVLAMPYSSGTTGLPKGVLITNGGFVAGTALCLHPDIGFMKSIEFGKESFLNVLPMYHIYGLLICSAFSITRGAKLVSMKKFDAKAYAASLLKYKPTLLNAVPPLIHFLVHSDDISKHHLDSCKIIMCGAAPLGESLLRQFFEKFGSEKKFLEGFGMTECMVTHNGDPDNFVLGSIGQVLSNNSMKIIDLDTGKTIGPGEGRGELCIKGPQVMKGYHKNEESTRKTIINSWLHTGDIATMDDEFNVYIVDRLKELIKVKGFQVAPAELEDLLRQHPSVEDVAVIGIPDERSGELPKAFIVLNEGCKEDHEGIINFVREKVTYYKRLEGGVQFIKEIPKSGAGKILRKDLRKLYG